MTHPSGVESIQICERMGYLVGCAVALVWEEHTGYLVVARTFLQRAHEHNEIVHWPTQIEPLVDRVLACDPSILTRVLGALCGERFHHACRPSDIARAISHLDAEIAVRSS
jgi:hypothetical protein